MYIYFKLGQCGLSSEKTMPQVRGTENRYLILGLQIFMNRIFSAHALKTHSWARPICNVNFNLINAFIRQKKLNFCIYENIKNIIKYTTWIIMSLDI